MNLLMRLLPLLLALVLAGLAVVLWPDTEDAASASLASLNIALLAILCGLLANYSFRLLRQRQEKRAGSQLRAKLVIALVGMLLIPAMILHVAANQMVEKGMNVWFDVRVDKLLDRAMDLAQGFYLRIDTDLKEGLINTAQDPLLMRYALELPNSSIALHTRMNEIMHHEGWRSLMIYDRNERPVAGVRDEGLTDLEAETLSDTARMTLNLGGVTTELINHDGEEIAQGYAPLYLGQNIVGILRAQVLIPVGVVQDSRAVEADYRSYRELERNRQAILGLFTHALMIVTLVIVLLAGLIAILFARRLTSPIADLADALQRVTDGDLDVSIPNAPEDELGSLVDSFNRMTQRLKQNVQALEAAQGELTEALNSSHRRQYVLEELLANLQSGVLLLDADGNIRLINEAARNLLQLDYVPGAVVDHDRVQEDMSGQLFVGHLNFAVEFYGELVHQQGRTLQRELELTLDHKVVSLLVRGARLEEAETEGSGGYLIVFDDISSVVEAQRHRAWAEVARRLAHEIKNPLTPIKLAAERLQRRFRKQVDDMPVFDTCTHTIIAQVERLQRLITDFSTLARMPQPRLRDVSLMQLMSDMRDLYSTYSRVEVSLPDEQSRCYCDPDQVRQILINLLDNALAATEVERQPVRLFAEMVDEYVCIQVQDEGSGIPEEAVSSIFEAYYSTKESGSGLGLAIAKRIAEEHEGDLRLLSHKHPTHFCLRLLQHAPSMEQA